MATETKGAEEAAVGMPQLDFSTFPNQIFWLIITLGAIYYILDRIALPRIAGVLAERTGSITNDIAAAEELKGKAAAAEAAYEQALAEARSEAQKIAQATRAEIQAELDEATAKADAEIDWSRSVGEVYNLIRGTNPQPGAWTTLDGKVLQIYDCEKVEGGGRVGQVVEVSGEGITVVAGRGAIRIKRVRYEGEGKRPAGEFAEEHGLKVGARLPS